MFWLFFVTVVWNKLQIRAAIVSRKTRNNNENEEENEKSFLEHESHELHE